MALAIEVAGIEVVEMAEVLGVTPQTVHNYLRGARHPKLGMVKQWALRCGVPWEWIVTGEIPPEDGPDVVSTVTRRQLGRNTLYALPTAA